MKKTNTRTCFYFFLAVLIILPGVCFARPYPKLIVDSPMDIAGSYTVTELCPEQYSMGHEVESTSSVVLTLSEKTTRENGDVEMLYSGSFSGPLTVLMFCKESVSSPQICFFDTNQRTATYKGEINVVWELMTDGRYQLVDTAPYVEWPLVDGGGLPCVCEETCDPSSKAQVGVMAVYLDIESYEDFVPVTEGIGFLFGVFCAQVSTSIPCNEPDFGDDECNLCYTKVWQNDGNFDVGSSPQVQPPATGIIKGTLESVVYAHDIQYATVQLYRQDAEVRKKQEEESIYEYLESLEEQNITLVETAQVQPDNESRFVFKGLEIEDNESEKVLYTVVVSNARTQIPDPENSSSKKMLYFEASAVPNLTAEPEASAEEHYIFLSPIESFVVNSTGDDSDADTADGLCDTHTSEGIPECTLRAAIEQANANDGKDIITFNIPTPGPHIIQPGSKLPTITDAVTIDGTTQPSYTNQDNRVTKQDEAADTMPVIDGSWAGSANGFHVMAENVTIKGQRIINFNGEGIFLEKGGGARIEGNIIGIDLNGKKSGNFNGIRIFSPKNTIGGIAKVAGKAPGNVISGNKYGGVYINKDVAVGNKVQGNLIGTNINGDQRLGNGREGVLISGASGNMIGGTEEGAGNVISGNERGGVLVIHNGATSNKVQGNMIGTNINGDQELGNTGSGVVIYGGSENIIGGTEGGAGNVISGNGQDGVTITSSIRSSTKSNKVQSNLIGLLPSNKTLANGKNGVNITASSDNTIGGEKGQNGNRIVTKNSTGVLIRGRSGVVYGRTANGNAILSNEIRIIEIKKTNPFARQAIGIDLGNDGMRANDELDRDGGPNDRQNYPELSSAKWGAWDEKLEIQGSLNSEPRKTYTIQFFRGIYDLKEGELSYEYFDSISVETDSEGNASIEYYKKDAPIDIEAGDSISATATDPENNTSEFSPYIPVEQE